MCVTNAPGLNEMRIGGQELLSSCLASDPRDKCFALLPMFSDATEQGLKDNYDEPVNQVFLKFGIHLLKTDGLRLLAYVQCRQQFLDLPSWIPDWSIPSANIST